MSLGDEHDATAGGYGGSGQTRTRLPEGSGDPYGGARRPGRRSSSRSMVTVVGVVVLLIAAIAFANRGSGDGASSDDTAANKPKTAATAATGTKPVQTNTAGIPTGFAHDQQGAQSAAANYAVTLGSTDMFHRDSRHGILTALYTPSASAKLQGPMDAAYSADFLDKLGLDQNGNAPAGNTFVSRVVPVGTTLQQYSDNTAKVAVWYMGLIGMAGEKSTDPVKSTWKTWTFDMQWADNDWKIVTDSQQDGPAPVPGDDRAASSDEISKAIQEYGGFTYAR
ncbi:hypothetical protein C3489_17525 [Streptomyces sp. Ru71]|uniref:hypothetical protein n=1 Tax=Streptomyces sp. Ru71 TaxID=2080746 RepID=UPI000CDE4332|nr:hypothetical protein [Streptomyces sp. Ru71]POX52771.1 hypothetical protein C3489_17525 [Streptomyces sp. Ru71]